MHTFGIHVGQFDERHDVSACYNIFFLFSESHLFYFYHFSLVLSNNLSRTCMGLLIFHAYIIGTADPALCNYVVYESLCAVGGLSRGRGGGRDWDTNE